MKKKVKVTSSWISIMGGICFVLFALVTLFSSNTPFKFLSNILVYSFGFVGFWLLLPFIFVLGIYLILNRRIFSVKIGVELWGVFILIICFLILSSHWASWGVVINGVEITGRNVTTEIGAPRYLTFSNSMAVFDKIASSYPVVIGPSPKLGGGKVGFLFAGAINSAITPIGLNIVSWIFFVGGLIMIFNRQIRKLIRFSKSNKSEHKESSFKEINVSENENESYQRVIPSEPIMVEKTVNNRPVFEGFHTSSIIENDFDLKKAHFVPFEENGPSIESKIEEIPKPTFESNKTFEDSKTAFGVEKHDSINIESLPKEKEYSEPFFEPLQDKDNEVIEKETFQEEEPFNEIKEEEPEVDYLYKPQPKANLVKNYIYPSIDLLDVNDGPKDNDANEESCRVRTENINRTLSNLHIGAQVVSHTVGPSVTRYDVQTNDDVSITAVQKCIRDISVRLGGVPVRFEEIVAGKSTSGLEIPNEVRTNVTLREALEGLPKGDKYKFTIPFGKSISGELKYADLTDFPHLLVAGTTGSGKSIFVHATILSLIMRNKPEELKLIMVDPKKVEMTYYEDIPHLLCPVISDLKKVYPCFSKLVDEMERRYNLFKSNRVRDIKGFNAYAKTKNIQPLPYIVVFIDEYADLIETCKEVRDPVVRIVQKARAAGIHMVFATQRPSVNVIDGVIKGNVSTRVALMCASQIDSMTVIGEGGAEKLLGYGDMLIECPLISRSMKPRVQGCYVSETEILRVCDFLREHYQPQFDPVFLNLEPIVEEKSFEEVEVAPIDKSKTDEEIYQRIKDDATHREYFSISYITRTYGMGFSRAGKIFTRLQREGVVALSGDAKGCKVLIYSPGGESVGTIEQSTFVPDDENID